MNETCDRCNGRGKVVDLAPYFTLKSGVIYSHMETLCPDCGGTGLRPQEAAKMILASVLKEEARS